MTPSTALKASIAVILAALIIGCTENTNVSTTTSNPLLEEWDTPFGTPPFDKIESRHYLPALRAGR